MSGSASVMDINDALRGYRDLKVWQKAMDLVELAYRLSAQFPKEEIYALTNQLRRAVVSIPSNIAEGSGRNSTRDFVRFLGISLGSLAEVETQMLIAKRLNYNVGKDELQNFLDLSAEIGRMLRGLQKSLELKISSLPGTGT